MVKRISAAILFTISRLEKASPAYDAIKFPAHDFAMLIAKLADIRLNDSTDAEKARVGDGVALATLKNHIAEKHGAVVDHWLMERGQPRKDTKLLIKAFVSDTIKFYPIDI